MVDAGVGTPYAEHTCIDKEGKEVSKEESVGMKVENEVTHPDCCVVMDETVGNTNMFNYSAVAGAKYVGRMGCEFR